MPKGNQYQTKSPLESTDFLEGHDLNGNKRKFAPDEITSYIENSSVFLAGTSYKGEAQPDTEPATTGSARVLYTAYVAGTYTNFEDVGGLPIVVYEGEAIFLYWNGSYWAKHYIYKNIDGSYTGDTDQSKYQGVVTTATDPTESGLDIEDTGNWVITDEIGTFTNFIDVFGDPIELTDGKTYLFTYTSSDYWVKQQLPITLVDTSLFLGIIKPTDPAPVSPSTGAWGIAQGAGVYSDYDGNIITNGVETYLIFDGSNWVKYEFQYTEPDLIGIASPSTTPKSNPKWGQYYLVGSDGDYINFFGVTRNLYSNNNLDRIYWNGNSWVARSVPLEVDNKIRPRLQSTASARAVQIEDNMESGREMVLSQDWDLTGQDIDFSSAADMTLNIEGKVIGATITGNNTFIPKKTFQIFDNCTFSGTFRSDSDGKIYTNLQGLSAAQIKSQIEAFSSGGNKHLVISDNVDGGGLTWTFPEGTIIDVARTGVVDNVILDGSFTIVEKNYKIFGSSVSFNGSNRTNTGYTNGEMFGAIPNDDSYDSTSAFQSASKLNGIIRGVENASYYTSDVIQIWNNVSLINTYKCLGFEGNNCTFYDFNSTPQTSAKIAIGGSNIKIKDVNFEGSRIIGTGLTAGYCIQIMHPGTDALVPDIDDNPFDYYNIKIDNCHSNNKQYLFCNDFRWPCNTTENSSTGTVRSKAGALFDFYMHGCTAKNGYGGLFSRWLGGATYDAPARMVRPSIKKCYFESVDTFTDSNDTLRPLSIVNTIDPTIDDVTCFGGGMNIELYNTAEFRARLGNVTDAYDYPISENKKVINSKFDRMISIVNYVDNCTFDATKTPSHISTDKYGSEFIEPSYNASVSNCTFIGDNSGGYLTKYSGIRLGRATKITNCEFTNLFYGCFTNPIASDIYGQKINNNRFTDVLSPIGDLDGTPYDQDKQLLIEFKDNTLIRCSRMILRYFPEAIIENNNFIDPIFRTEDTTDACINVLSTSSKIIFKGNSVEIKNSTANDISTFIRTDQISTKLEIQEGNKINLTNFVYCNAISGFPNNTITNATVYKDNYLNGIPYLSSNIPIKYSYAGNPSATLFGVENTEVTDSTTGIVYKKTSEWRLNTGWKVEQGTGSDIGALTTYALDVRKNRLFAKIIDSANSFNLNIDGYAEDQFFVFTIRCAAGGTASLPSPMFTLSTGTATIFQKADSFYDNTKATQIEVGVLITAGGASITYYVTSA